MQTKLSIPIVESQADYLRLSLPTTSPHFETWNEIFLDFELRNAQEGCDLEEYNMAYFKMRGYGGISRGRLRKTGLFQAAGPQAHEIIEATRDIEFDGKCKRLDSKMTAHYHPEQAKRLMRRLIKEQWQAEKAETAHASKLRLFDNAGQGDTLYFGDRKDGSFTRAYQAAERHPERYKIGDVSFEVQHNEQIAPQAWHMMRRSANTCVCAGSLTIGKLTSIGVKEPWMEGKIPDKAKAMKHKSTKEGTLKWIESSVRGSFTRARREGWYIEYLERLGFGILSEEQATRIIETLESTPSGHGFKGE